MEDNNKNNDKNSIGYILGTILGATGIVCVTISVIAVTVKFLTWLF